MAKACNLLRVATAELGTKESPAGSNRVKYNTEYYGQEVYDGLWGTTFPWCAVFVWWCCKRAGVQLPIKTASCGTLMASAKTHQMWVTSGLKPGDIVIYDFPRGADTDHCGIVESVSNNYVTSIEGNTAIGNDSNGGEVMRRTRPLSQVVGAVRPHYEGEEDDEDVVRYQYLCDVPQAFRPTIKTLMDAGIILGDGGDPAIIDLSHDQVRTLVFSYRGGAFDAKLRACRMTPAIP